MLPRYQIRTGRFLVTRTWRQQVNSEVTYQERIEALEAKCALLSASLKQADAENDRLKAEIEGQRIIAQQPTREENQK